MPLILVHPGRYDSERSLLPLQGEDFLIKPHDPIFKEARQCKNHCSTNKLSTALSVFQCLYKDVSGNFLK